jgi:hypothetical protein
MKTDSTRNVKTKAIPVIIGATGTISKSFRKYLSNAPGEPEVKRLHKTAIFSTAHTHTRSGSANVHVQNIKLAIPRHVPQTVTTEQLQHRIPYKHGLF